MSVNRIDWRQKKKRRKIEESKWTLTALIPSVSFG